jgi:hypothetical protein
MAELPEGSNAGYRSLGTPESVDYRCFSSNSALRQARSALPLLPHCGSAATFGPLLAELPLIVEGSSVRVGCPLGGRYRLKRLSRSTPPALSMRSTASPFGEWCSDSFSGEGPARSRFRRLRSRQRSSQPGFDVVGSVMKA